MSIGFRNSEHPIETIEVFPRFSLRCREGGLT